MLTSAIRAPNDKLPFHKAVKGFAKLELMNVPFNEDCQDTKLWTDWSTKAVSAVLTQDDKIVRQSLWRNEI